MQVTAQSCLPGTDPVGVLQVTVAVIQEHLSFLIALATAKESQRRGHLSHKEPVPSVPRQNGRSWSWSWTTHASVLIILLTWEHFSFILSLQRTVSAPESKFALLTSLSTQTQETDIINPTLQGSWKFELAVAYPQSQDSIWFDWVTMKNILLPFFM